MTPLYMQLLKAGLQRAPVIADRGLSLLDHLNGAACFELSEVFELIEALRPEMWSKGCSEAYAFLPAPATWIEWRGERHVDALDDVRTRSAYRLFDVSGEIHCEYFSRFESVRHQREVFDYQPPRRLAIYDFVHGRTNPHRARSRVISDLEALDGIDTAFICVALSLINSPRVIGRQQHMPHRGLERMLARQKTYPEFHPLSAWTEIKLKVAAPQESSGDPSVEAHLTGDRAFHFCRAHYRIRMGRLEFVRAHNRGNPGLGVKPSRYRLQPGEAAQ